MAYAKSRFGKFYYEIKGSGEPVIMIRGLGRWSEHWVGFDKRLAEHWKVITFDSRGLGRTTTPLLPWNTMTDLAADIALILRTERIDSAHVVGTSLGGMIALEFAAKFPQMAKSVTAINSSVGRSGHRRLSWGASHALMRAAKTGDKMYPELARVLLATSAPQELVQMLAKDWQEVDKKYSLPIAIVTQQLLVAMRWRHITRVAQALQCPVQIVSADEDQFVPRGNSLFLANRIPGALFTKIPNSGHETHVDQPEALEKALSDFFTSVSNKIAPR